ncbi:MAG: hypothetical protein HC811_11670, partial [Flammeovirgaceae bacterium]|nr:hypothetical protein [Flammeovirgaceae bacterium]
MRRNIHFIFISLSIALAILVSFLKSGTSPESFNRLARQLEQNVRVEVSTIQKDHELLKQTGEFNSTRYTTYKLKGDSIVSVSDNGYFPDIRLITDD